jgi:hypothetical protein
MLRLLFRLWWLQQRRSFTWKDAVVGGYLIFVYVMVGLGFYFGATLDGEELFEDGTPDALCAILVLTMLAPDIILKVVMKHDSTAMDDYLKSRPVPEKVWNRFLLLTNLANFWNYVMPVLMLPMLFWMLSMPQAIVGYLLMQAFSFINGIYVTCYYKTTDWMLRWPLLLGWIGMGAILTAYLVCFAWMPGFLINIGMAVWAVLIITGLLFYLYNLKIYNEHKQKTSRFRSFGKTTLYKLQYIGLLRAKRVRNMVLVMVIIFFLDALLMVFLPDEGTGNQVSLIMYVVGDVLLPSVVLSQWTFGIEANFFQGLMTKPVKVEQLLRNCFYFYLSISGVMTVISLVFVFLSPEITVFTLLGAMGMAVFINLSNLPTCLFSSRLEIFSNSMFNMQGANMKINLYGIVFLVPTGLMAGVYYLWGAEVWCIVSVTMAVVCLLIHRKVIARVAAIYDRRRYERMEKYMEN